MLSVWRVGCSMYVIGESNDESVEGRMQCMLKSISIDHASLCMVQSISIGHASHACDECLLSLALHVRIDVYRPCLSRMLWMPAQPRCT